MGELVLASQYMNSPVLAFSPWCSYSPPPWPPTKLRCPAAGPGNLVSVVARWQPNVPRVVLGKTVMFDAVEPVGFLAPPAAIPAVRSPTLALILQRQLQQRQQQQRQLQQRQPQRQLLPHQDVLLRVKHV